MNDTNNSTDTERRAACILITAATGDSRCARGIISRAARSTLKIKRLAEAPHSLTYHSRAECEGTPERYILNVTDNELQRVLDAALPMFIDAGFDCAPIDVYHD